MRGEGRVTLTASVIGEFCKRGGSWRRGRASCAECELRTPRLLAARGTRGARSGSSSLRVQARALECWDFVDCAHGLLTDSLFTCLFFTCLFVASLKWIPLPEARTLVPDRSRLHGTSFFVAYFCCLLYVTDGASLHGARSRLPSRVCACVSLEKVTLLNTLFVCFIFIYLGTFICFVCLVAF